jgi:DNA-binding NarL/FixJ family response regulator
MAARAAGVVIADDQPDIRTLLATRLGLDPALEVVGEAANGAEAIDRVHALRPAALILDLQMPVMSGEEAIPVLRSLAPDLRILVFSAFVGLQRRLSGSGRPDAEVAKGGDLGRLVEEVHRLLEGRPADILHLDLGDVDVAEAEAALEAWTAADLRLRPRLPPGPEGPDLMALVGVFLSIREVVAPAARRGAASCRLRFATRVAAARGARSALSRLDPGTVAGLEPLAGSLLAVLPP